MRVVKFVADFAGYKTGDVREVDDQTALNAFVQGCAVSSIEPFAKAVENAPETIAAEQAPEAVVAEVSETTAPDVAPETVTADSAPETK